MPTLGVLYPSTALAATCDPLAFATSNAGGTVDAALAWARERVRELLPLFAHRESVASSGVEHVDVRAHPFAWQGPEPAEITPEWALHLAHAGRFAALGNVLASDLRRMGCRTWQLDLLIGFAERDGSGAARAVIRECREARRAEPSDEDSSLATPSPTDERWYWAAPLLLDLAFDTEGTRRWWSQAGLSSTWSGAPDDAGSGNWRQHVELAHDAVMGQLDLGPQPNDLVDVLALTGLGSPGVTALRALTRAAGTGVRPGDLVVRNAAAQVAWGFRALFNVPEVIALVRSEAPRERYWQRMLAYCVNGNLQATLDEYCHVLVEHLGLIDKPAPSVAEGIGAELQTALTVRPARLGVDRITVRPKGDRTAAVELERTGMRARFAARFGDDESDEGGAITRTSQVRAAFNSPFWPFVLATTSVGQEGLDFHLYCHAVVHWNLPTNPVDLEQREGRVHRYKGHAVRKNLATRHGPTALAAPDPWLALFELGCADRRPGDMELVPYWLYAIDGGAQIERHVPRLPYSRDASKLTALRRSLAVYRMAFGQSRQDDLVAYLLERLSPEEASQLLSIVKLDLGPRARSRREALRGS
jgi:hypothetical protein